jgi:predicted secreted Zn-dependent protease
VWIRLTWKKNGTMDVEDDEDCREIKKKISQEVHKMAQGSRTESNQ